MKFPALKGHQRFVASVAVSAIGDLDFGGVLTTDDIARDGNIWVTSGMDVSKFLATRTINFDHNSAWPVAQLTELTKEPGKIRFRGRFSTPGVSVMADSVRGQVKDGTINSLSASIVPLEMEPLKDSRGRQVGWRITKSDLVDFAIVSAPANAGCLITERSAKASRRMETTDMSPRFNTLAENLAAVLRSTAGIEHDRRLVRAPSGANETDPAGGGFAIQDDFAADLINSAYIESPIIGLTDRRTTDNPGRALLLPAVDETSRVDGSRFGGVLSYWAAEGNTVPTSFPRFRQIELRASKLISLVAATSELVADAQAFDAHLRKIFAAEFSFQLDRAIISGTGAGVPLGIMNAPCTIQVAKDSGQASATITETNVSTMWRRLPAPSRQRAVWLVNEDAEDQLEKFGTGSSPAVYLPAGFAGNPYPLLKGRPVIAVEQAPALGMVGDIILADLSEYIVLDGGLTPSMSAQVHFNNDEVLFRFVTRVDGKPNLTSPITPYNGTVTRSPFVTLAAR